MTRQDLENALASRIDEESQVGIRWWPGKEMAPIAYRRWSSFSRRHPQHRTTFNDRIRDLAKGLQAHFEPDVPYTPDAEWVHLATLLGDVFLNSTGGLE